MGSSNCRIFVKVLCPGLNMYVLHAIGLFIIKTFIAIYRTRTYIKWAKYNVYGQMLVQYKHDCVTFTTWKINMSCIVAILNIKPRTVFAINADGDNEKLVRYSLRMKDEWTSAGMMIKMFVCLQTNFNWLLPEQTTIMIVGDFLITWLWYYCCIIFQRALQFLQNDLTDNFA